MAEKRIHDLGDLSPHLSEHLLPAIKDAVEVCVNSYHDDPFNDNYTFGTQLWRNLWNRFRKLSDSDDCPFKVHGAGNEYKLKLGPFVLRHHRIDRKTRIPRAGKAAKTMADMYQLRLWDDYDANLRNENIIIAIDADPRDGLREVFYGELENYSQDPKRYQWARKFLLYLADGVVASTDKFVQFSGDGNALAIVPEEEIPEVSVGLDESKVSQKLGEKG